MAIQVASPSERTREGMHCMRNYSTKLGKEKRHVQQLVTRGLPRRIRASHSALSSRCCETTPRLQLVVLDAGIKVLSIDESFDGFSKRQDNPTKNSSKYVTTHSLRVQGSQSGRTARRVLSKAPQRENIRSPKRLPLRSTVSVPIRLLQRRSALGLNPR